MQLFGAEVMPAQPRPMLPLPQPFYFPTLLLLVCSASTAIKRYMQLCRIQQTDSCLSPLDDAAQLAPLADKWQEYFVFTFVSVLSCSLNVLVVLAVLLALPLACAGCCGAQCRPGGSSCLPCAHPCPRCWVGAYHASRRLPWLAGMLKSCHSALSQLVVLFDADLLAVVLACHAGAQPKTLSMILLLPLTSFMQLRNPWVRAYSSWKFLRQGGRAAKLVAVGTAKWHVMCLHRTGVHAHKPHGLLGALAMQCASWGAPPNEHT